MTEPSTEWREQPTADEGQQLQKLADAMGAMQTTLSARFGKGRALHRKGRGILKARFEVLADTPAWTRQGVFASAGSREAVIRLSNASAFVQKDATGDIRGLAIKILGITGPGALGSPTTSQDFLLINQDAFGIKDARDFVAIALAAGRGPAALIGHFVKTHGFFGCLAELKRLGAVMGKPFAGFLDERFSTAVPVACGPFAVRLRLVPAQQAPGKSASDAEIRARIAAGDNAFDVQLQGFVNEASTPIEDASVNWDEAVAPWVTVGRLTIPQQSIDDGAPQAAGEELKFDPWNALVEHRPLGQIMRARRAAYYTSQLGRGV
jgi:hypothetical protein